MKFIKDYLSPLCMLIVSGVMLYDHYQVQPPIPGPVVPTVNGVALGRAYGILMSASYGEGWDAAAFALEQGKSLTEAHKTLQDTWKASSAKHFKESVQPVFSVVLPEGTEPTGPEKRSQVATLWRDFAKGLRNGK